MSSQHSANESTEDKDGVLLPAEHSRHPDLDVQRQINAFADKMDVTHPALKDEMADIRKKAAEFHDGLADYLQVHNEMILSQKAANDARVAFERTKQEHPDDTLSAMKTTFDDLKKDLNKQIKEEVAEQLNVLKEDDDKKFDAILQALSGPRNASTERQ